MSDQNFEKKENNEKGISRRKFLKTGIIAGGATIAGLAVGLPAISKLANSGTTKQSLEAPSVPLVNASFLTPQIPLPGKNILKYQAPLAHFNIATRVTGTSINVDMVEFPQLILPAATYPAAYAAGTWVWGYKVGSRVPYYPGFTIQAQKGVPTTVNYLNSLPGGTASKVQPLITVDQTLKWADPLNRGISYTPIPYTGSPPACVHLHGGEVPSGVDGGPNAWFTADGLHHGPGYYTDNPLSPANGATYIYPNGMEASNIWFHDHALGATRTNVYSGLAAFYLIRDGFDDGTTSNLLGLPADDYEIEMAIQDKQFDTNGQLLFPDGYPAGLNGPPTNPTVHPYWIPEFIGDVIVINGNSWPYLNVEPRRYRFRIVDGSNARFYSLSLKSKNGKALPIWQIGTDGGLLDAPVMIAPGNELLIAPGERADIIIDFTGVAANTVFTLYNSARAPYPKGTTPDPQTVGQLMEFRVILPFVANSTFDPAVVGATLRGGTNQPPLIRRLVDPVLGTPAAGITPTVTRQLTLNEVLGPGGPLEILINNSKFGAPQTELPLNGSTEQWDIINLTADAHPIHLHLVQFQLMNRQTFQTNKYIKAYNAAFPGGVNPADGITYPVGTFMPGFGPPSTYTTANADGAVGGNPAVTPFLQGRIMPPKPNEAGWKDTVQMNPGEVTRIIVQFKTQAGGTFPFDPTTGPGYVWHCHIIDHEDNEMMRPYHPV
jgi:FtsP/CotA-like multicopper oxidase with cupredoxin domain